MLILRLDEGGGVEGLRDIISMTFIGANYMAANSTLQPETRKGSFAGAFLLFLMIVFLSSLLAWMFSPLPVIFAATFDNNERNQQYLPCAAFTIVDERLRVTVAEPHSGCSVRLPNEYENFTFTANVFPVDNVHDGSINLLLRQGYDGWYEIQFRPETQQINFISFVIDSNGKPFVDSTTDWKPTSGTVFKNSGNRIRVTVTEQWIGFWFNDARIFSATCETEFPFNHGVISIGVGAGDVGGVAFDFDELEIREEKFLSRWWYDFLAIQKHKNSRELNMVQGRDFTR
jgi:hypothetical protein